LTLAFWYLGINSIFATSIAMLVATGIILWRSNRARLFRTACAGAIGMTLVMFVIYWLAFELISDSNVILRAIWSLYGTSLGILVLRVPLSELVWAFCFGAFFSVLFMNDRINQLPESFDRGSDR
jgi:hypothetical protein